MNKSRKLKAHLKVLEHKTPEAESREKAVEVRALQSTSKVQSITL